MSTPEDMKLEERIQQLREYLWEHDDVAAHLELGDLFAQRRDWKKALAEFDHAQEIAPQDPAPLIASGKVYENIDLFRAKECYHAALSLDDTLFEPNYRLGVVFANEKDWKSALQFFTSAVEIKPDDYKAQWNLAYIYGLRQNNLSEALPHLDAAFPLIPQDDVKDRAQALGLYGRYHLYETKDFGKAQQFLEESLQLFQGFDFVHAHLGLVMIRLEREMDAIPHFLHALQLSPSTAEYHYNLGKAYYKLHQHKKALPLLMFHSPKEPADTETITCRGMTCLALELHEEALISLQEAHQAKPESIEVLISLSFAHKELGDLDQAMSYLQDALKIEEHPWVHLSIASLLFSQYHLRDAKKHFEKALQIAPHDGYSHLVFGDFLAQSGYRIEGLKEALTGLAYGINSKIFISVYGGVPQGNLISIFQTFESGAELFAEVDSFIKDEALSLEQKLEALVTALPLVQGRHLQEYYGKVIDLLEQGGRLQLERDDGIQSSNVIMYPVQSSLLDASFVVKKSRKSSKEGHDALLEEHTITKYIEESLQSWDYEKCVVDSLGLFERDGDTYLIMRRFTSRPDEIDDTFLVKALENLAHIHAAATSELQGDEIVFEDVHIPLSPFDYMASFEMHFADRFPDAEEFSNMYFQFLAQQQHLDHGKSRQRFFLNGDAYPTNVLSGGVWIDWERKPEGSLGDPLYDVSYLLSSPFLTADPSLPVDPFLIADARKLLLGVYVKSLPEFARKELRNTFLFNLLHTSLCRGGNLHHKQNTVERNAYFAQALQLMPPALMPSYLSFLQRYQG